jgi:hypothetical protein
MSSSPWEKVREGNEDVAAPFEMGAVSSRCARGRLRLEWSVAGTAPAWHDADRSQSAGEIVPDLKLSLPRQWEDYCHDLDGHMTDNTRFAYDGWLCRWESMTNASAQCKSWVTPIQQSTNVR